MTTRAQRRLPEARQGDGGWFQFWNRPGPIHMSERHLQSRYRALVKELLAALPDLAGKRILDYGCGEALEARTIARAGAEVLLYDRSEYLSQRVQQRFRGAAGIRVLDDDALERQLRESIDYILVASVIQYLEPEELEQLLALCHRLLKPGGTMILADIIPRQLDTLGDTLDFLHYSARNRFLFSGLRTLYDMGATNYRRHLKENRLTRHDLEALSADLRRHGFQPRLAQRNIGISRKRKTMFGIKQAPRLQAVNGA
jgi:2-polyprenyl-3-methyl-5-hydroxy-6-metoxy-1,4-benzoquinol methylase